MLDYNEFTQKLQKELLDNMSADFRNGYETVIKKASAPNNPDIVQDVLIIENKTENKVDAPKMFILPIYEDLYKRKNKGDFDKLIKDLAKMYEKLYRNAAAKSTRVNKQETETHEKAASGKNVFFIVENYEEVKEQLNGVVHQQVGDYVLIANLLRDMNEETIHCEPIGQEIMNELGMTEKSDVIKAAIENTEKLFPTKLEELNYGQYYITNEKELYGATCVFMPGGPLATLSDMENKDILVIPASKNGCILEPIEEITDDVIKEMKDALSEYGEYDEVLGKEPLVFSHEDKKLVTSISQYVEKEQVLKTAKTI